MEKSTNKVILYGWEFFTRGETDPHYARTFLQEVSKLGLQQSAVPEGCVYVLGTPNVGEHGWRGTSNITRVTRDRDLEGDFFLVETSEGHNFIISLKNRKKPFLASFFK